MKKIRLSLLKTLSKYFEIELIVRAFGSEIVHVKFPPSNDSLDSNSPLLLNSQTFIENE